MTRLLANAHVLLLLSACSLPDPKHPTHTRPLDEGTAIRIISLALQQQGETPTNGRNVQLNGGHFLRIDVGAAQKQFGIAYLTDQDWAGLDPKEMPPRAHGNDLWITQGAGPDADAVILLLDAKDYFIEESRQPQPASTTTARADERLARDVRDFVVVARERKLP